MSTPMYHIVSTIRKATSIGDIEIIPEVAINNIFASKHRVVTATNVESTLRHREDNATVNEIGISDVMSVIKRQARNIVTTTDLVVQNSDIRESGISSNETIVTQVTRAIRHLESVTTLAHRPSNTHTSDIYIDSVVPPVGKRKTGYLKTTVILDDKSSDNATTALAKKTLIPVISRKSPTPTVVHVEFISKPDNSNLSVLSTDSHISMAKRIVGKNKVSIDLAMRELDHHSGDILIGGYLSKISRDSAELELKTVVSF